MSKGLFGSVMAWAGGTALALAVACCPESRAQDVPTAELSSLPGVPVGPAAEQPIDAFEQDERPPVYFWSSAEFLLWRIKDGPLPIPLVTTAPLAPGAVPPETLGGLGQANTTVLFGGTPIDYKNFLGGRFNLGWWMDPDRILGLECGYFFLGQQSFDFRIGSDGNGSPFLARPFFDTASQQEITTRISIPGIQAGRLIIGSASRLWGFEVNAVNDIGKIGPFYTHLLVGYRQLELKESLLFTQETFLLGGAQAVAGGSFFEGGQVSPPATVTLKDRFDTRSDFYGAQAGFKAETYWGPLFAHFTGKLAMGVTHEIVDIFGTSGLQLPDRPQFNVPGGQLAQLTNIGKHSHADFTVVPEAYIAAGYHITTYVRVSVGYNILFWSQVFRPGEQLDREINATQVPTSARFGQPSAADPRPIAPELGSSFWAQGLTINLALRY